MADADMAIVICPSCGVANRVPDARLSQHPKCGRCAGALFAGRPLPLDTASFDRLMRAGTLPVLVDFWAGWCGPCRTMAPHFEAAAADLEPRVRLGKVDVDAQAALSARYGVRSIPTLILFDRGRELARHSGIMERSALVRWVTAALLQR